MGKRNILWIMVFCCAALWVTACSEATSLSSLAGIPHSVKISPSPAQNQYYQQQTISVNAIVLDALDDPVENVAMEWQDPTSDRVLNVEGRNFKFIAVGNHSWTVKLAPPYDILTDSIVLKCVEAPDSVEIVVTPQRIAYQEGSQIVVDYVVKDENGTVIEDVPATWVTPAVADVASLGNNNYQFIHQGDYTWTVTLNAPFAHLSASRTLSCSLAPVSVRT